jgi:2-iminobutanoate/2-iminopropanoate deaminase
MQKTVINPQELFNSVQYGFSQIVVSEGTRMVHLSGQVAWDVDEQIANAGDLRAQVFRSLENLKIAMECAGGTMQHIVSLRIYIVQSVLNDTSGIKEGLKAYFPENPPASTWIGVPGLASGDFLVEIEATAVLD